MIVFLWGGGAGLSALCSIFKQIWFDDIVVVDKYQSEITDRLQKNWIEVVIWDWKYNFSSDDVIIYSDTVENSKDFEKVKDNRKFSYFQFLWEVSKRFKTIAVAWTHWKTSTTSMLINCLKNHPDFALGIVGGFVPDLENKNFFVNQNLKSDIKLIFEKILSPKWARPTWLFKKYFFALEADEFNRHFLLLDPYFSLITKVDHDHKDIYPTYEDYLNAFKLFIQKTSCDVFTNDKAFADQTGIKCVKESKFNFKYIFWDHMQKNASLVKEFLANVGYQDDSDDCLDDASRWYQIIDFYHSRFILKAG